MSSDYRSGDEAQEESGNLSGIGSSTRRNFNRGAVGGAVFMTLGSRGAWGLDMCKLVKDLPGPEKMSSKTKCISTGVLMSTTPSSHHHLAKKGGKTHYELQQAFNTWEQQTSPYMRNEDVTHYCVDGDGKNQKVKTKKGKAKVRKAAVKAATKAKGKKGAKKRARKAAKKVAKKAK